MLVENMHAEFSPWFVEQSGGEGRVSSRHHWWIGVKLVGPCGLSGKDSALLVSGVSSVQAYSMSTIEVDAFRLRLKPLTFHIVYTYLTLGLP